MVEVLDGNALAEQILASLNPKLQELQDEGQELKLVALQVGENPASLAYLRTQCKKCDILGIKHAVETLPEDASQDDVEKRLCQLNEDPSVTGIIIQRPLPPHIDAFKLQGILSPLKDVEGTHPENLGLLLYGQVRIAPSTPMAVMEILKHWQIDLCGLEVVIIGHSQIVGKPLALLMLQWQDTSPTPTICHIATRDLAFHTKRADVLIVAAGKPGLVRGDMVKEGVTVIDVGINRVKEGEESKLVGDVAYEEVAKVASYITPVPGGVGPVTTAMLISNLIKCALLQKEVGI